MTKKFMREAAKRILGNSSTSSNPSKRGLVINKEDHNILIEIFENHPDYPEWDIKAFEVVKQECDYPKYNDFNIHMRDNTIRKHASYNVALKPKKTNHDHEMLKQAMRHSIQLKHGRGNKEYHLDHSGEWTFQAIFESYPKDIIEVINHISGGQTFTEKGHKDFITFHDERAILKLIPAKENLSKGNKDARRS